MTVLALQQFSEGFNAFISPDSSVGDVAVLATTEDLTPPPGWTKQQTESGWLYSKELAANEIGEWIYFESVRT